MPITAEELSAVLTVPDAKEIQGMSLPLALLTMIWLDLRRPFQLAKLRREMMCSTGEIIRSLGGLLSTEDTSLEAAIGHVRRQSWLTAKMAFLDRTHQVFQLWHVVHRPFSYSFAVLAIMHITLVLLMGYF
jgi:hypothetical protein